jgi:hypothetical protein
VITNHHFTNEDEQMNQKQVEYPAALPNFNEATEARLQDQGSLMHIRHGIFFNKQFYR